MRVHQAYKQNTFILSLPLPSLTPAVSMMDAVSNLIVSLFVFVFFHCQRVMNRKQTLGKPDQRDLNENLAATHGLAHMIQECRKLFRVSSFLAFLRLAFRVEAKR